MFSKKVLWFLLVREIGCALHNNLLCPFKKKRYVNFAVVNKDNFKKPYNIASHKAKFH